MDQVFLVKYHELKKGLLAEDAKSGYAKLLSKLLEGAEEARDLRSVLGDASYDDLAEVDSAKHLFDEYRITRPGKFKNRSEMLALDLGVADELRELRNSLSVTKDFMHAANTVNIVGKNRGLLDKTIKEIKS
jgi:hypothetical protein